MDSISFLLLFLLFVLFIFLTIAFLYAIYIDTIKKKFTVHKTQLENKIICEKYKWKGKLNRLTNLIWLKPKMILTVVVLGFFFEVFLIIANTIFSLILALIFFILYIYFIKFIYDKYFAFREFAKKKLQEHEEAIKDAVMKQAYATDSLIQKYRYEDEYKDVDFELFTHPKKDVKKAKFPPFIDIPDEKRDVVLERVMQFIVLGPDFLMACLNPTPFNLEKPLRDEPKKKCALLRKPGDCKEVYYSQIKTVFYKDQYIHIVLWDEKEEPIKIFVKKKPDAGPLMTAIKARLRITERQRLGKIQEQLFFENLLQKRKLEEKQEESEKKENEDENNKEEKQKDNEEKNS